MTQGLKPYFLQWQVESLPLSHWGSSFVHLCVCAKLLQSFPTLCDRKDCSSPGFSVHGILQTITEVGCMSSFRGSSWPKDWIHDYYVSCIGRQVLYHQCYLESICIIKRVGYMTKANIECAIVVTCGRKLERNRILSIKQQPSTSSAVFYVSFWG